MIIGTRDPNFMTARKLRSADDTASSGEWSTAVGFSGPGSQFVGIGSAACVCALLTATLPPLLPLLLYGRGEFLHRAFTFANGHLTSSSADPGASAAFTSPVTIERILILGLADGPAGWTATVAGGRPLTATPGPLHMEPALPDSALVIRKPELNIGQDFSIAFKRGVN